MGILVKNNTKTSITIDHRENPSEIPQKLTELGAQVTIKTLQRGDYIINQQIIVERKSKEDFVLSLMQNRLFIQIANLKKADYQPLLLIEGNPYHTKHDICREAIKGALIAIAVSWQLPIVYSSNADDSAQILMMTARQNLQGKLNFYRPGYHPKSTLKKQIFFLQGLPEIGPKLAHELLKKFGTIENIILAGEDELLETEGIGKKKAAKIREFLAYRRKA